MRPKPKRHDADEHSRVVRTKIAHPVKWRRGAEPEGLDSLLLERWCDRRLLGRARLPKAARQVGPPIADLRRLTQSATDPVRRTAILEARVAAIELELQRLAATRDLLAAAAGCGCGDVTTCAVATAPGAHPH